MTSARNIKNSLKVGIERIQFRDNMAIPKPNIQIRSIKKFIKLNVP